MSEEWTEWLDHDGMGCPCIGKLVQIEQGNGRIQEGIAGQQSMLRGVHPNDPKSMWVWNWKPKAFWIIRYRIRKPRALLQLIEMVENLPAPAQPRVDA